VWHVSVSYLGWPAANWSRAIRRRASDLIRGSLRRVGEGPLMWEDADLVITMQAKRWLNDAEVKLLPQHRLPELWTEEDERRARAGELDE